MTSSKSGSNSVPTPTRWTSGLALLLVLLYSLSVGIKVYDSVTDSPKHLPFHWKDETAYFWTESAFQYRYARMIAVGKQLPKVDTEAQYPEGLDLNRHMTVLMEYVCGWLYRNVVPSKVPLHFFVIFFMSVISSVSIVPVYIVTRMACGSSMLALGATAFYVLNPASSMRVVGTFEYENFSVPMFFLALMAFCRSIAQPGLSKPGHTAASSLVVALLLIFSLMSWHFATFLVFGFMFLMSIYAFALTPDDESLGTKLRGSLLGVGAIIIGASVCIPSLRGRMLPTSWLAASIYAAWACAGIAKLIPRLSRPKILVAYLALVAGFLLALQWLNPEGGMYGHVYQLAASKLRFLLSKPSNPAMLPFDARCLWIEAFDSPAMGTMIWLFAPAVIIPVALVPCLVHRVTAGRSRSPFSYRYSAQTFARDLLILMGLFSFGLYLLIDRLSILFVFFLAALLACSLKEVRKSHPRLAVVALLLVLLLESWKIYAWDKITPDKEWLKSVVAFAATKPRLMGYSDIRDVIHWMKHRTSPHDPILAAFQTSPMLLTYADRPILLHPKFEDARLRLKVKEFLDALYGSEESLHALAKRYGAEYFLYQADFILDTSADSPRYMADRLVLPVGSAASKFHFFPEQLKLFELVHQNFFFRIFRVKNGRNSGSQVKPFHVAWYDPDLLGARNSRDGPSQARVMEIQSLISKESRAQQSSAQAIESGDLVEARRILVEALPQSLHPAWLMAELGSVEFMAGKARDSLQWFSRAIAVDPYLPYVRRQLAVVLYNLGRRDEAYREAQMALHLNTADAELYGILGFIRQSRGQHRQAAEAFQEAILLGSDDVQVKQAYPE